MVNGGENIRESIDFVIGEDKRLSDILKDEDVLPVLNGALKAGVSGILITDEKGTELWSAGVQAESYSEKHKIYLEGEGVGYLEVKGSVPYLKELSGFLYDALNMLVKNNLKRLMTTEIHTTVVSQSYQELVETNKQLSASEQKYRELAESLEEKVKERTAELKSAYAKLMQQEKMASVGQLAAGVAHEVNNPIGFVTSNLKTLQTYILKLFGMLSSYKEALEKNAVADSAEKLASDWKQTKIDFIGSDSQELIKESIDGVVRVKNIVASLRGFSHIDDTGLSEVDINSEIENVISVMHNMIPADATIVRNFKELPLFKCSAGAISQVFYNIIHNSVLAKPAGLRLELSTWVEGSFISIRISDNGPGIPGAMRTRIFDPFFTTREVGKGMGLGLTIAYDILKTHKGSIDLEDKPGTSLLIKLPYGLPQENMS